MEFSFFSGNCAISGNSLENDCIYLAVYYRQLARKVFSSSLVTLY